MLNWDVASSPDLSDTIRKEQMAGPRQSSSIRWRKISDESALYLGQPKNGMHVGHMVNSFPVIGGELS